MIKDDNVSDTDGNLSYEDCQKLISDYCNRAGYRDQTLSNDPVVFQAEFTLTKPYGGYSPISLDALIQSAIAQEAMLGYPIAPNPKPYVFDLPLEILWRDPLTQIPFYNTSELMPVVPQNVLKQMEYHVKRPPEMRLLPLFERRRDGSFWQPAGGAGQWKDYVLQLPTTHAPDNLIAYGRTHAPLAEIERLLATHDSIGKKRQNGFGQIKSVGVTVVSPPLCVYPDDWCCIARQTPSGQYELLRYAPMAALQELGFETAKSGRGMQMAFSPPYWLPANQRPDVLPVGTLLVQNQGGSAAAVSQSPKSTDTPAISVPDLLLLCENVGFLHNGNDNIVLIHPKLQPSVGIGELDVISGLPITGAGAVHRDDVFTPTFGNVADILRSPNSEWLSNSSAIVMSDVKKWHRSFFAVWNGYTGIQAAAKLYWPTLAPDTENPTRRERPLWREVWLELAEKSSIAGGEYQGWQQVCVFTNSPKPRFWPQARIGNLAANQTLIYLVDDRYSGLIRVNVVKVASQMQFVEMLLERDYGKNAIWDGNLRMVDALHYSRELDEMRGTQEFIVAWQSARTPEDKMIRSGELPPRGAKNPAVSDKLLTAGVNRNENESETEEY